MVVHTCQGDAEEEKPGNVTLNYDIEPLPFDLTPEQRFFEGRVQTQAPAASNLSIFYITNLNHAKPATW